MKLIEKQTIERDYGFDGTIAIIDHPDHGRVLIEDGYGSDGLNGACVRWAHGLAIQLQPGDTLQKLMHEDNPQYDHQTYHQIASAGRDDTRSIFFDLPGHTLTRWADTLGLK